MVGYILEPFGVLLVGIGDAISIILSPLFSFTSGLEETGSMFTVFSQIFGSIGKVLRFILETLGKVIGGLLHVVVGILVPFIKAIATVISVFTNIIGYVFNVISEGITGVLQFFQGLFTLDFGKMGAGIWNMFSTLLLGIPNLIGRIIAGIPSFIVDGISSIGTTIVNGVMSGISALGSWLMSWFTQLPSNVYSALYAAASAINMGWLVARIGGKPKDDKEAEKGFSGMAELAEHGMRKGSIYTHDISLERQLIALNAMFAMSNIGALKSTASAAAGSLTATPSGADMFSGIQEKYESFKQSFFDSSFFNGMSERYQEMTSKVAGLFGPIKSIPLRLTASSANAIRARRSRRTAVFPLPGGP
jgi:phage-related protein